MLVYPQLSSGALSQFPVRKQISLRTIVNRTADGSSIKAPDYGAGLTEWTLSYTDLSDTEAAILEQFFADAEGTLNSFTFLDPMGNLFAASDELDAAAWEKDPLLTITSGVDDPQGGELGWHLQNTGTGPQRLVQTLAAPTGYQYCLSVYTTAPRATTVTLLSGSARQDTTATTSWSRFTQTSKPDVPQFGIEIPAGAEVTVFGMQVEPQPSFSAYQPSITGGVYEGARLKDNSLRITTTGYNRHSCTVKVIHANHL